MQTSLFPEKCMPLVIQPSNKMGNSLKSLCNWLMDNREDILNELYKYGALLLRGFDLNNIKQFENCASIIGNSLTDYCGGDSPRDKLSSVVYTSTSYPPEYKISMHNEKSFSKIYPNLLFLFCDIPPDEGGETPILDGRKIYSLLDKNIIDKFMTKKLKYVMNLHDGYGIGKSWKECFETSDKNEVEKLLYKAQANFKWKIDGGLRIEETVDPIIKHPKTGEIVYFAQADQWHPSNLDKKTLHSMQLVISEEDFYHHCYYGDGSHIEIEYLEKIRNLTEKESISFQWEKGDFLVLDNILTLHGRYPYKGNRRILVAMS